MKLNDLEPGDKVELDGGFTCMDVGAHEVCQAINGHLFVECDHGQHYLDSQENENGDLVGFISIV